MAAFGTFFFKPKRFQEILDIFNDVPSWQKRGVGLYCESYLKEATNPLTQEKVSVFRKRLKVDRDLPMGEAYSDFIKELALRENSSERAGI